MGRSIDRRSIDSKDNEFNYKAVGIDVTFTEKEKERIRAIKKNKTKFRKNKPILALPTALPKNQRTKEVRFHEIYMKKLVDMYGSPDEGAWNGISYEELSTCFNGLIGKDFNRLRMGR